MFIYILKNRTKQFVVFYLILRQTVLSGFFVWFFKIWTSDNHHRKKRFKIKFWSLGTFFAYLRPLSLQIAFYLSIAIFCWNVASILQSGGDFCEKSFVQPSRMKILTNPRSCKSIRMYSFQIYIQNENRTKNRTNFI